MIDEEGTRIKVFRFQPFQSDAIAGRPLHYGLIFPFRAELVAYLKRCNQDLRQRLSAGKQAVHWLPESRAWLVHEQVWDVFESELLEDWPDIELVQVQRPMYVQHFNQPNENDRPWQSSAGDRIERNPPVPSLESVLMFCKLANVQFRVKDGKLTYRESSSWLRLTDWHKQLLKRHADLLVWLLHQIPAPVAQPVPPPRLPDPYQVLGVRMGASQAEISAAYKRLIRQVHPDRVPSDLDPEIIELATKKAAAVNAAFSQLQSR